MDHALAVLLIASGVKSGTYSVFHVRYLVIKNIAYFPLQCALNSRSVMNAVLDSLIANGIRTEENSMTADAAVIWSVLWHGRMAPNRLVYEHYRAQNKPVIVIEIGALYRGNTWKMSVNHVNALGYFGHQDNLDWNRPKKLGISCAVNLQPRPEVVVAAQHSRSLQVINIPDMAKWVYEQVGILQSVTDRPIVVRPHPRCPLDLRKLSPIVQVQTPQKVVNTYDSFDMHYNCHAVVNYNSGPGIQAAIAGVRPVVHDTSLAYPVSVGFADIEQPYDIDRTLWLTQICHTEYTLDELKQGTWLKRLETALMT